MKNPPVFILSMLFYCFYTTAFASLCSLPINVDTIKLTFDDCKPSMYKVDNECFLRRQFLTKTVIVQGDACSHSNLKWKVLVDNWADSLVEYEFNSELTVGDDISNVNNNTWENIKDDNNNGIPDIYLKPNEKSTSASIVLIDIEGKRSKHSITWIVTDDCGNSAKCQELIEVRDTKAPTPVCVPLSVGVFSDPDSSGPLDPGIEIWANDFINKSYDNCTPENMLLHTFDNIAPQNGNKVLPGNAPNVININVDHYFDASGGLAPYPIRPNNAADRMVELRYLQGEHGIQKWIPSSRTSGTFITSKTFSCVSYKIDADIKVTVWDKNMNNDYCWTTFRIIHPSICSKDFKGKVVSLKNSPVDSTKISLFDQQCQYTNFAQTNSKGEYYIYTNLNLGYKIEASYDFLPMIGLDQNDLLTIWAHVKGARLITNPYKMKAADINDDGAVTLTDALLLEKALKSKKEEGFGQSMVAYSDTLVNLDNWHHKISTSKIDTINWYSMINDFIDIKKGDVDGSYFDSIPSEALSTNFDAKPNDIKISPNPYNDYSIVSYTSDIIQDMEMSVYDYTGKLVFTNDLPSSIGLNYTILNESQIEKAGVYILEIVGRNSRLSSKLVKID